LTILSRLRKLEAETIQTASDMPISIDIKQDYLYNKGLEEGKLEGILEGQLIANVEDDVELLCRMAHKNVAYDLMSSLSDVPDDFLNAFRSAWSADKGDALMVLVREARELSGLEAIRQHLTDALTEFGIAPDVSMPYLKGSE
jgi:hypothetical protein